ncbi:MAG: hypothetical protein ACRYGR_10795 [Janthinobacterium lividum]
MKKSLFFSTLLYLNCSFFAYSSNNLIKNELLEDKSTLSSSSNTQEVYESSEVSEARIKKIPSELWDQLIIPEISFKTTKLHHVNRYFYTLVTKHDISEIDKKGLLYHLNFERNFSSKFIGGNHFMIDFKNIKIRDKIHDIPSYVWSRIIFGVIDISFEDLPSIQKTNIQALSLSNKNLSIYNVRTLIEILQNSKIDTLVLLDNNISEVGIDIFIEGLPKTKITNFKIKDENMNPANMETFIRILPETQVQNLIINDIDTSYGELVRMKETASAAAN